MRLRIRPWPVAVVRITPLADPQMSYDFTRSSANSEFKKHSDRTDNARASLPNDLHGVINEGGSNELTATTPGLFGVRLGAARRWRCCFPYRSPGATIHLREQRGFERQSTKIEQSYRRASPEGCSPAKGNGRGIVVVRQRRAISPSLTATPCTRSTSIPAPDLGSRVLGGGRHGTVDDGFRRHQLLDRRLLGNEQGLLRLADADAAQDD